MFRALFLVMKDDIEKTWQVRHIQYNIQKRLRMLKYISYMRINIAYGSEYTNHTVVAGYGRNADIMSPLPSTGEDFASSDAIVSIYRAVIDSLKLLWQEHQWNVDDLETMLHTIQAEEYTSWWQGKVFPSPDRSVKAALYAELYPAHTDYYLRFIGRGNKCVKSVHFLKGFQDIDSVLAFCSEQKWTSNEHFSFSWHPEITIHFYTFKDAAEITYDPVEYTLEGLHNFVKAQQAGISTNERLRLKELIY